MIDAGSPLVSEARLRMNGVLSGPASLCPPQSLRSGARRRCHRRHQLDHVVLRQAADLRERDDA
jgi:hypothetical protein